MTEQEWLERGRLLRMVRWLRGRPATEQLRLFRLFAPAVIALDTYSLTGGARIAVRGCRSSFAEGEATPSSEAGQEGLPRRQPAA